MTATLSLAKALIRCPSVTPEDAGCQDILARRLGAIGFHIEPMRFADVSNLWARRGAAPPLLVFAGHTDVVPPGPLAAWQSDPFCPEIRDGFLFGRGAADMKTSLAAMVTACERFIEQYPAHPGSIGFLITSDEEGPAVNGTVKVIERLQQRNEKIDACIVGEPSSSETLGDIIKNGRRGSLSARLIIRGVQGHVAYPAQVLNPIHAAGPLISRLCAQAWDNGNDFFPPTSFQISNIGAGTGAGNVVPGSIEMQFNFRFSTELKPDDIKQTVTDIIETTLAREPGPGAKKLSYELDWNLSGLPFLTVPGELVAAVSQAVRDELGRRCELSTSGGTSDARFIAPGGAQVIELGPVNRSIHQVNECVQVADIERLSRIYEKSLCHFFAV